MEKIKLAVLFYSSTGANYQMVQWAADAAKEAGAEVRLLKIPELAPLSAIEANPAWKKFYEQSKDLPIAGMQDLEWADAYIFSTPTWYGNIASQMQQFIDTTGPLWAQGKLSNKIVSAMATAMNAHGGQESTILSLYHIMCHWGAIIVPPGYTNPVLYAAGGNPYGTSAGVDKDGKLLNDIKGAVEAQAIRTIAVAQWIKNGKTVYK
ncbi:MAG: NAD(P)H:quinone oxidoreductase [Chitinophagaceae bacterium]|nr:NAD(P)H:quinone oxidoreductase [Chitinophagaceae bacterium]